MSIDGIASVNATIITVIIGAAAALALIALQSINQMTHDLVEAANVINDARLIFNFSWGDIPYDPQNAAERGAMTERICNLMSNYLKEPMTDEDRGLEMMHRISLLGSSYPFPSWVENGPTVPLGDVADVNAWLSDIEPLLARLTWTIQVHHERIRAAAVAADQTLAADHRFLEPGLASFYAVVDAASRAVADVKRRAGQIDRYKSRIPGRQTLLIAFASIGIVLLTGVLIPMVWAKAPKPLYVGVPILFYVGGMGTLLWWVGNNAPVSRRT